MNMLNTREQLDSKVMSMIYDSLNNEYKAINARLANALYHDSRVAFVKYQPTHIQARSLPELVKGIEAAGYRVLIDSEALTKAQQLTKPTSLIIYL